MAPPGLSRVFFADSGSIAVEVALKIALQYWLNKGKTRKDHFLCFSNGYHGDTFGAMAVSDPARRCTRPFRPSCRASSSSTSRPMPGLSTRSTGCSATWRTRPAAMIVEPLVQGAGGMRFHSPEILSGLARMAKKHDVLFIADEIATGFWRTGHRFACEAADVRPTSCASARP